MTAASSGEIQSSSAWGKKNLKLFYIQFMVLFFFFRSRVSLSTAIKVLFLFIHFSVTCKVTGKKKKKSCPPLPPPLPPPTILLPNKIFKGERLEQAKKWKKFRPCPNKNPKHTQCVCVCVCMRRVRSWILDFGSFFFLLLGRLQASNAHFVPRRESCYIASSPQSASLVRGVEAEAAAAGAKSIKAVRNYVKWFIAYLSRSLLLLLYYYYNYYFYHLSLSVYVYIYTTRY